MQLTRARTTNDPHDANEINRLIRELVPIPEVEEEQLSDAVDVGMLICILAPGIAFWSAIALALWILLS